MSRPRALKNDPEAQEAAKAFANLDAKKARDANDAIAILERRARSATIDVELPGGDVIPIRSRLSREEMVRYWELMTDLAKAEQARDPSEAERLSNELLGLVMVVDGMSQEEIAAWLGANQDAIADLDAAEIIIQSRRIRLDELARHKRLLDFRDE